MWIIPWLRSIVLYLYTLQGVISKNLQKPYICGRGGYNSWSDDAYHVDTLGPTKTYLGARDDRGGYHWSRCHTPLGHILQGFFFFENSFY